MKRAFDANVSRARPRTRTVTTEVAPTEKEPGLSADLAAALVGPRSGRNDLRRARAAAGAAGEAASQISREEAPAARARDGLAHKEQQLALRAGDVALGTARSQSRDADEGTSHKQRLAQAMRNAAARVAEAAAEASGGRQALQTPAWVVKAALPSEDLGPLELTRSQTESSPVATKREAAMNRLNDGRGDRGPSASGASEYRASALAPTRATTTTVVETAAAPAAGVAPGHRVAASGAAAAVPPAPGATVTSGKDAGAPARGQVAVSAGAPVAGGRETGAPAAAAAALARDAGGRGSATAPVVGLAAEVAPTTAAVVAGAVAHTTTEQTTSEASASGATTRLRTRLATPAEDTVLQGRARIAELRGRLAATTRPRVTAAEVVPADATAVVRQAVDELRARLVSALADRDALARSLEATRDELAEAHKELHARSAALEEARSLAREREGVAEDLAAEAEALAEERDQALARILDLKALDEQQTALLADAEEALADRDRLLAEADRELQELASLLDLRAAEAEELSSALEERTRERDVLASRLKALEAEVEGLSGTREALAEIQRLVSGTVPRGGR